MWDAGARSKELHPLNPPIERQLFSHTSQNKPFCLYELTSNLVNSYKYAVTNQNVEVLVLRGLEWLSFRGCESQYTRLANTFATLAVDDPGIPHCAESQNLFGRRATYAANTFQLDK